MNVCFSLSLGLYNSSAVETYEWHVYVVIGNFDTRLSLFFKDHVDYPVNSDWMF